LTQITIEVPDDLVRRLEALAKAEDKSMSQVVLEHLRPAVEPVSSPQAILLAMAQLSDVDPSAVDEMNAAIAAGQLAMSDKNPFRQ
jgi:predicted transcriptional regulator